MDNQSDATEAHGTRCQYYSKAQRAQYRALTLAGCFAYVTAAFMVISLGLQHFSGYVKPQMEQAVVNLEAQSSMRHHEQMLSSRLDDLLSSHLTRGFLETYEDCLTRGLHRADAHFFGQGFQYPNIRNETITWTTENCRRLWFAPQLSKLSPSLAIRSHLTQNIHSAGRALERALALLRVPRAWKCWVRCHALRPIPDSTGTTEHREHMKPTSAMPFGFELECDQTLPCRLVDPAAPRQNIIRRIISDKDLNDAVCKVVQLSRDLKLLNTMQRLLKLSAYFFMLCELLCSLTHGVLSYLASKCAPCCASQRNMIRNDDRTHPDILLAFGLQFMTAIFHVGLGVPFFGREVGMMFGIFLVVHGLAMLLYTVLLTHIRKHIVDIWAAIMELHLVIQGQNVQSLNDMHSVQLENVDEVGSDAYPSTATYFPVLQQTEDTSFESAGIHSDEKIQSALKYTNEQKNQSLHETTTSEHLETHEYVNEAEDRYHIDSEGYIMIDTPPCLDHDSHESSYADM